MCAREVGERLPAYFYDRYYCVYSVQLIGNGYNAATPSEAPVADERTTAAREVVILAPAAPAPHAYDPQAVLRRVSRAQVMFRYTPQRARNTHSS